MGAPSPVLLFVNLVSDVFFVVGPTAVGKTDIAVAVAENLRGEIVSADAFQIYRGLDILAAQPGAEEQRCVRHYLLGSVSVSELMSAAKFRDLALGTIAQIRHRNRAVIVVSGSGLYVRALTHGFDHAVPPDPNLREQLSVLSTAELANRLQNLHSEVAATTDLMNRRRLIRAIEIVVATATGGKKVGSTDSRPTIAKGVLLVRDREDLYQRINKRVETMFADGVESEVRELTDVGQTAAHAIGLREIQQLLAGEISRAECIAKIQQATRRYAKRQLTWFRHQTSFPQLNLTNISQKQAISAVTTMAQSQFAQG